MPFRKFGLLDPLVRGILASGYAAPTQIQTEAIPAALEGRDIVGCAQTGTGKTAAFVLPILDRLYRQTPRGKAAVRALVVTPTRELAVQIEQSVRGYGRFLSPRVRAVYGGVGMQGQLNALRRGVDIVVATPGRLLDHMQRRSVDLRHVEVLVLDEADRMLDMGFILDVRKIIRALPKKRQTMLFSATIPPEIEALAAGILSSPVTIQIGKPRNPIDTVTHYIYPVLETLKMDLLLHLLKSLNMCSVLVFSRTKRGADRIHSLLLHAGVSSVALHSGRNQQQRQQALAGFKAGKHRVMVATDIAARGIDIIGISHVVNYDVPRYPEDYIHRIGRTGRAEATGDAITFVSIEEDAYLCRIEKFIGREFKAEQCGRFTHKRLTLSERKAARLKRGPLGRRRPVRRPRR